MIGPTLVWPTSCELHLPREWAADAERRERVRVPSTLRFREKWRILLAHIREVPASRSMRWWRTPTTERSPRFAPPSSEWDCTTGTVRGQLKAWLAGGESLPDPPGHRPSAARARPSANSGPARRPDGPHTSGEALAKPRQDRLSSAAGRFRTSAPYSHLNGSDGSTVLARRAGRHAATTPEQPQPGVRLPRDQTVHAAS